MLSIILSFVVVLFYSVYQCCRMRHLPPYFDGCLPIIGHSYSFLKSKNYYSLLADNADVMLKRRQELVLVRLGIWNIHVIVNPDDACLVANSSITKDVIYDFFKPFAGEGLITAGGHTWKIHRKILNPTFNQQVLDGYLYEINNQTRQLMENIDVEEGKGYFDHHRYFNQTILQIVCATSMGTSIDEEDKQTREMFTNTLPDFFFTVIERVVKFWLHNDFIFQLTGHKKKQDLIAYKLNFLSQAILKKKKIEFKLNKNRTVDIMPGKRFKPFIELLLELSEKGELSDKEITDELNTFFAAGTDTMAVTVSNALTCIGTYGAVQDKIFKELQEVFEGSDRDVEKQDLSRLKYLDAVIKETIRLYPAVPLIGRILDKDTEIKGYTLPAGSKCYIGIYGILRHWTWGPDAYTFRPERWLDGSLPDMKGFPAFGLGKRSCIGANFGIMCIKTVLASFLRRYSINSDVTKMVQEFYVTAKPVSGFEISIKKRHSSRALRNFGEAC